MTKYVSFFTHSSEAWGRMISAPGDRTAALRPVLDSVGGSLDAMYWMSGDHLATHELFSQEQLGETLARARNATQVYRPPGQQG